MECCEVGIEAMNVYAGTACLDVRKLIDHRELDIARFNNLLMSEKTVALVSEDPVTFAVNAAKPILDALSEAEKNSIEMLITCTESGIDFGKSISTYVHDHLGLNKNCRVFEVKQACYSGTVGLHNAANFILSNTSPGAKALVIAVDLCRFMVLGEEDVNKKDWAFSEPSGGAGAVAMLISNKPEVFRLDVGASGYYSYEVMDTCRPQPDSEAGNADISLMSYLDCCEQTFLQYQQRVDGANYAHTFDYLAFHTPFGGMVKGAHRSLMRKFTQQPPAQIEADYHQRVTNGLTYCQRIGNIMGGALYLSLAGVIETGDFSTPRRIGCFAYGSGCCSEFYSGIVTEQGQARLKSLEIASHLESRYQLSIEEYERSLRQNKDVRFGTQDVIVECPITDKIQQQQLSPRLYLKRINNFHREYEFQ
ncbi:hydroxymethylglutaryl-CoA synthase family protein [Alkalimonas collagenimarina]|uniref:Hydroxymethylglutaryl-CoA synthase family protein n=1 Tax=Alkalimonas collagenimarina TaxID=400390 RepID=A0ABT9H0W3_9GAMM|nr:hydroxymethylglutaryl-CoA synthase family protein [Alkalimonas collagenimarina]MDP4536959.1 hydroxymethylglutaryl-CoA synthase family protein [Alkalimonas collagenimarina]